MNDQQRDELESLKSMYTDDLKMTSETRGSIAVRALDSPLTLRCSLVFEMTPGYPETEPPLLSVFSQDLAPRVSEVLARALSIEAERVAREERSPCISRAYELAVAQARTLDGARANAMSVEDQVRLVEITSEPGGGASGAVDALGGSFFQLLTSESLRKLLSELDGRSLVRMQMVCRLLRDILNDAESADTWRNCFLREFPKKAGRNVWTKLLDEAPKKTYVDALQKRLEHRRAKLAQTKHAAQKQRAARVQTNLVRVDPLTLRQPKPLMTTEEANAAWRRKMEDEIKRKALDEEEKKQKKQKKPQGDKLRGRKFYS